MPADKKKVLMLPKWYPNKFNPFNGNFVENHIKAISRYDDPAVLFVHSDPDLKKKYHVESGIENDFPVVRVYFRKPAAIPVLYHIQWINRYIKSHELGYEKLVEKWGLPDISHVHVLSRTGIFALRLLRRADIPFIITEHWSGYLPERNEYSGLLNKRLSNTLAKKAGFITTVSDNLRKGMVMNGLKGNYELTPNVVDTRLFRPPANPVPQQKKRIVHVSTLSTIPKQLPEILKAVKELSGKRDDFELHIYGEGKEGPKQRQLAQELGITGNYVFFHGNLKHEKLAKELREASFMLLYSLFENQPCVIIEAYASGIPVLSSDVGGIPELVDRDKGMLVEAHDRSSLVRGMHEMLDNTSRYSPEKLHEYAKQNFSPDVIGKKFHELYQKCIPS